MKTEVCELGSEPGQRKPQNLTHLNSIEKSFAH